MPQSSTQSKGSGSSPLARGTHGQWRLHWHLPRFIPARAGNTDRHDSAAAAFAVHPRSRGEHQIDAVETQQLVGSSPLARGTPNANAQEPTQSRFIPARAGNTPPKSRHPRYGPVHPRSRGEHLAPTSARCDSAGSSPLARGTQVPLDGQSPALRFIPARAGNTTVNSCGTSSRSVHPRSRGEHDWMVSGGSTGVGSSPLARGTPVPIRQCDEPHRFIPARAGNTVNLFVESGKHPVHPRSRGEHPTGDADRVARYGSSPLARGTQAPRARRRQCRRFIPARAGNTLPGTC